MVKLSIIPIPKNNYAVLELLHAERCLIASRLYILEILRV
ncbi:hypothetical protein APHNP_1025 [Anaplasma phagocytophilum str. ApNP]|uniref:Uncharacterized protein n=1 Tax=Anaplasma phagocytophilum str. ApNP TaxID=1359153 RepID=A0A0F3NI13_ANAPH|nr:hypothetical protein APHNP_1025 [Anaplasma phagocytophilum str. ApNP]